MFHVPEIYLNCHLLPLKSQNQGDEVTSLKWSGGEYFSTVICINSWTGLIEFPVVKSWPFTATLCVLNPCPVAKKKGLSSKK